MCTGPELIVPYVSYITLGIVLFVITSMVLFKLATRDNRFLSNAELYIYSRPELNQRKNNAHKKPRQDTFLEPNSIKFTTSDSIPLSD